jgi:alpha-beta hydrolase superfamily lysophospholipase
LRQWLPAVAPRAVVVAVHGFNDYSKSFDTVPGAPGVGPNLAHDGIAVIAYDQRGFGAAPNHGIWPGSDALTADLAAITRSVKQRFPGVPVYGLGESMGGAVILAACAGVDPPPFDGIVLSAPAVWARATMPAVYRVALWLGARILPGWRPTGQSLGRQASDNIDMLRDNGRDPLFIKKTRIDSVYGLVNLMDRALAVSGSLKIPALYLYGRNDQIIPPPPSAQAMGNLLAGDPRARAAFYDQGWHMMLRDKQAATVIGDIAAFIGNQDAALPSGADQDALPRLQALAKKH